MLRKLLPLFQHIRSKMTLSKKDDSHWILFYVFYDDFGSVVQCVWRCNQQIFYKQLQLIFYLFSVMKNNTFNHIDANSSFLEGTWPLGLNINIVCSIVLMMHLCSLKIKNIRHLMDKPICYKEEYPILFAHAYGYYNHHSLHQKCKNYCGQSKLWQMLYSEKQINYLSFKNMQMYIHMEPFWKFVLKKQG